MTYNVSSGTFPILELINEKTKENWHWIQSDDVEFKVMMFQCIVYLYHDV